VVDQWRVQCAEKWSSIFFEELGDEKVFALQLHLHLAALLA
jgi:hypothetical protein